MRKVERFLKQQGMRKEQIEKEMEKAYEQYFSSLSKKEGRTMYTGPKNAEQEKEEASRRPGRFPPELTAKEWAHALCALDPRGAAMSHIQVTEPLS